MKTEEPRDVGEQHREERQAKYPRIFENNKDSTLHVLYVAALAGFIVWVLAEGVKFSDSQSLALTVFFVVSIAGGVLGGPRNSAVTQETKPQAAAQPEILEVPEPTADCNASGLEPKPSFEAAMETR
jgi:hypothetical protein